MASLWIRSGCDMKVDPSVETYQVGVHFKALIKAILVAPSRILENFFSFHVSLPRCGGFMTQIIVWEIPIMVMGSGTFLSLI